MAVARSVLVLGAGPNNPIPGIPESATGVVYEFASTLRETEQLIPDAEIVFLWEWHTNLLKETWPIATKLRWVHVIGVGIEWALFPELVESDVMVTNSRGVYDRALAEYAIALLLAMTKDLRATFENQKRRRWDSRSVDLLEGKQVMIVGLGSIGRSIGRALRSMGVSVSAIAARAREDTEFGLVASTDELADRVGQADFVVLAAPSTKSTQNLMNRSIIERMKPTARIINLGRGDLINDEDLIWGLKTGHLGGAALDVFREEPLPANHPFWKMPTVIISPHMSGIIPDWEQRSVTIFLESLTRWLRSEPLENVIDKRLGYVVQAIE